jgi:hypothetical protein
MIFLFESLRELFRDRSVLSGDFMKLCFGALQRLLIELQLSLKIFDEQVLCVRAIAR